jgi:hypothetical protein
MDCDMLLWAGCVEGQLNNCNIRDRRNTSWLCSGDSLVDAAFTERSLGVRLDTNKVEAIVGFRLSNLEPNRVFSAGASLEVPTFQKKAAAGCQ